MPLGVTACTEGVQTWKQTDSVMKDFTTDRAREFSSSGIILVIFVRIGFFGALAQGRGSRVLR
jgi:hypothetical protein